MRNDDPRSHQGTSFLKADFHIHTPESMCYGDLSATPERVVDAALAAGLAAIAITDHNTFAGVDAVREIARANGLVVFPGAEFSTREGHVLALFDSEASIAQLNGLLSRVGVSALASGDGSIPTRDGMEAVLRKIVDAGGIAVAAHIERWPTGFLQTNESRRVKMRIHGNECLSALEITQPENKRLWNMGQVRNYPKRYACVQGSDAHALEDIGRRPTYLRLPSIDLEGLRVALEEYETRVRFPEEMPRQR
jgi:predicted metal-dependent phosphoesterase TrpH